jgi:hypothetical protein
LKGRFAMGHAGPVFRISSGLWAGMLMVCVAFGARPALGQVSTNDQALDSLKPAAPPAPKSSDAPAAPRARAPVRHAVGHGASRPVHAAKPGALPRVPAAPPANPVIAPPPMVMPVHKRANPPPVPIKADAVGVVSPMAGGSRITFGPGVSSLNQATMDAILAVAARAKTDPTLMISVTAWAPGTVDDPSTPRTLALERALAARAVLINAGIVSNRILAVSKGFAGIEGGPPDRLEITAAGPKQTPAGKPVP